jgi:hypothetical protein
MARVTVTTGQQVTTTVIPAATMVTSISGALASPMPTFSRNLKVSRDTHLHTLGSMSASSFTEISLLPVSHEEGLYSKRTVLPPT